MAKKYDPQAGSLFKKDIPKMPEGCYSGDKPNPNLRAFVEQHIKERPYDPENDDYDVQPSIGSIKVSKRNPVYGLHSYDSKKPPEAVQKYVEHFTRKGDIVFDPFIGSGMTSVASLRSRRKCVAIDLSPLATFITSQYCSPVNLDELYKAVQRLSHQLQKGRERLYTTKCGRCGNGAEIYCTVYSQTYQCPRCMSIVPLFDALTASESMGSAEKFDASCPTCAARGVNEAISTRSKRHGYVPVMMEYQCGCSPKEHIARTHNDLNKTERQVFEEFDLPMLRKIEKVPPKEWYPTRRMLWNDKEAGSWGVLWRPYHGDIRRVDQFFTPRNLDALSCLLALIHTEPDERIRKALRFVFSAFVLSQSKLQRYHPGSTFPNMIAPGLLYVAPMIKEYNVFQWFEGKVRSVLKGFAELQEIDPHYLLISTESATALDRIPANSVDYIFTDPPYSGRIQYGELNFIQEAWLDFASDWRQAEIIVNTVRGKDESDWAKLMKEAFQHCYRVLKPGRWLSLCYHDSAEGTWAIVQDLLTEVGFIPEITSGAVAIDAKEKSLKQITADKITKRDLVINFRKPKLGEVVADIAITGNEDVKTFNDKVRQIIRDYVGANPGSTKDHIYDEVVSRMVRSGQMEAHDFGELLSQVAEEAKVESEKGEEGRWYLKESELTVADAAEAAREDVAAHKIGEFIKRHLKIQLGDEGVHYSDLFEHYIYAAKDKPRRQLVEFLPDYFYKTEQGTWRLPASEEEEKAKHEARVKGLGRRVKRYIAQLEQGAIIPDHERPNDATLAEWIRHCKRAGLYEQGKLLYEKGGLNPDNLPEEAMVNVEEDYQVCARMLARAASEPKRRGRKKAED